MRWVVVSFRPCSENEKGGGRRMLGMLKRHEIEILLKAGHPKTEAAHLAGVSARSVDRIAEESPIVDVNDSAERALRRIGPSGFVQRVWRRVSTSLARLVIRFGRNIRRLTKKLH